MLSDKRMEETPYNTRKKYYQDANNGRLWSSFFLCFIIFFLQTAYTYFKHSKITTKLKNMKALLKSLQDFVGGPVVKNLPTNVGDARWIPGRGPKIPTAMERLSLHVAASESTHLK